MKRSLPIEFASREQPPPVLPMVQFWDDVLVEDMRVLVSSPVYLNKTAATVLSMTSKANLTRFRKQYGVRKDGLPPAVTVCTCLDFRRDVPVFSLIGLMSNGYNRFVSDKQLLAENVGDLLVYPFFADVIERLGRDVLTAKQQQLVEDQRLCMDRNIRYIAGNGAPRALALALLLCPDTTWTESDFLMFAIENDNAAMVRFLVDHRNIRLTEADKERALRHVARRTVIDVIDVALPVWTEAMIHTGLVRCPSVVLYVRAKAQGAVFTRAHLLAAELRGGLDEVVYLHEVAQIALNRNDIRLMLQNNSLEMVKYAYARAPDLFCNAILRDSLSPHSVPAATFLFLECGLIDRPPFHLLTDDVLRALRAGANAVVDAMLDRLGPNVNLRMLFGVDIAVPRIDTALIRFIQRLATIMTDKPAIVDK